MADSHAPKRIIDYCIAPLKGLFVLDFSWGAKKLQVGDWHSCGVQILRQTGKRLLSVEAVLRRVGSVGLVSASASMMVVGIHRNTQ